MAVAGGGAVGQSELRVCSARMWAPASGSAQSAVPRGEHFLGVCGHGHDAICVARDTLIVIYALRVYANVVCALHDD